MFHNALSIWFDMHRIDGIWCSFMDNTTKNKTTLLQVSGPKTCSLIQLNCLFAESPGSPLDLAVDNIKFDSCSLTWSPPWFDGRSPILHYTVEMRVFESDSFGHWKCCKDVIEPKASIDLVAGRQYSFRVKAANINGDGIPSPESKHITPTGKM